MKHERHAAWAAAVMAGSRRDLARAITEVEAETEAGASLLRSLQPRLGRARVIGVTGAPGAGKSTLVSALIGEYRGRDLRVGVLAVDPSSPFSGGAVLGDRVRMGRHSNDDGVFIRSLASRGHLGGVSRTTARMVDVLDAAGFDVVLVETVGAGQSEVEIAGVAQVRVVVCPPGLGDEVQAIKAGILEIADVLVVNKSDLPGADATVRDLREMLRLRRGAAAEVPVMKTSALSGEGVAALANWLAGADIAFARGRPGTARPGADAAAVDRAIASRRSVRRFLPTPVPRSTVEEILAVASRAPSGTNTQPWRVTVLAGERLAALSRAILDAFDHEPEAHREEYDYYPVQWSEPYLSRRRKVGWDLYGLLGITREDKAGMHRQFGRNYRFFDAPVGLIFTIERALARGSWLDYGMFLQNVMVAARGRGLDTCPQAAFNRFHRVIERELALPATEMVVCGMSLGHADPDAPENRLATEREPVAGFARFLGFD